MYGYGSKPFFPSLAPILRIVLTNAQAAIEPKKTNTNGYEPMLLRTRSAARSPRVSCLSRNAGW